jgi:hypothetical protein
MILTSFYSTIGPKYDNHPDLDSYFTYFKIFEKIVNVLEENYLDDTNNDVKCIAAYCIGFSFVPFLFSSNTNLIQNNEILKILEISQKDYYTFSLKNDAFVNLISGTIFLKPEEEELGCVFLNSELFCNFIKNQVNIKEILQVGTSSENPLSYEVLKENVYNLLSRVANKVISDRRQVSIDPGLTDEENGVIGDMTPVSQFGLTKEEEKVRLARLIKQDENYQKNKINKPNKTRKIGTFTLADLSKKEPNSTSSNSTTSTTSTTASNGRRGGRKTRKKLSNKTKKLKNKKSSKRKTIKLKYKK